MRTSEINRDYCPACASPLDRATSIDPDEVPSEDDVTVCLYCRTVLQFNADLSVRKASAEVIEQMEPEIARVNMMLNNRRL